MWLKPFHIKSFLHRPADLFSLFSNTYTVLGRPNSIKLWCRGTFFALSLGFYFIFFLRWGTTNHPAVSLWTTRLQQKVWRHGSTALHIKSATSSSWPVQPCRDTEGKKVHLAALINAVSCLLEQKCPHFALHCYRKCSSHRSDLVFLNSWSSLSCVRWDYWVNVTAIMFCYWEFLHVEWKFPLVNCLLLHSILKQRS